MKPALKNTQKESPSSELSLTTSVWSTIFSNSFHSRSHKLAEINSKNGSLKLTVLIQLSSIPIFRTILLSI